MAKTPPPLGDLPDPGKTGNKKPETYVGEGGLKYGSQNAADNSYIRAAASKKNKNATAISYYKDLLAGMGVKAKTRKEAAALAKFVLSQASRAGADESPRANEFKKLFIQKFYKTYLQSAEGSAKVAEAKAGLQAVFGDDWLKQVKGNKELAKIIKNYAGAVNKPTDEQFQNAIKNSKTWKEATAAGGEYQYLKDFNTAQMSGSASLFGAEGQIASYKDYQDSFRRTMAQYGATAEQALVEEQLFFKSGVAKDDFAKRFEAYNANKQAYYDFVGEGLTDQDRQAVLYGGGVAGQGMRDKLGNVADINNLYQGSKSAYQSVMGGDLNANQKKAMLLNTGNADVQALKRSGNVAQTLAEQGGAYSWMQGKNLDQEQRKGMLYEEGNYKGTYDALKRAFNVADSYRQSRLSGFGQGKNEAGTIVQGI